jgi:hypothetical protein
MWIDESRVEFDSMMGTETGDVGATGTRVAGHRGGFDGDDTSTGGDFIGGGKMVTDGAGKRIEES